MLVVFSPIFVADTKIIYGYNFVAPLIQDILCVQGLRLPIPPTLFAIYTFAACDMSFNIIETFLVHTPSFLTMVFL